MDVIIKIIAGVFLVAGALFLPALCLAFAYICWKDYKQKQRNPEKYGDSFFLKIQTIGFLIAAAYFSYDMIVKRLYDYLTK